MSSSDETPGGNDQSGDPFLSGQLLIAMPGMQDERFAKTVIYMCAHTPEGAMGLVLNQALDSLTFPDLLEQLGIEEEIGTTDVRVHVGGPVEAGRGFVLHSADYSQEATLPVDDDIALTATVDILKAIARGRGPRKSLLALGYRRLGAGSIGRRDQGKRLAAGARRSGAGVRPQPRQQVGAGHRQAGDRSPDALRRGRPRLSVGFQANVEFGQG